VAVKLPRPDEFAFAQRAAAEYEILSSGHESLYGLWDLAAAVNTVVAHQPVAHVLRLAQAVVNDQLERGLLELMYGRELDGEEAEIVAAEDRAAVLADPASWDPYARSAADPYYTITSTPEGIEAYYALAPPEQP
jgi:hypothetical protein